MNFRIPLYDSFVLHLQNFLVDIKGPALAFFPMLAFEGGTRRYIPKFERCVQVKMSHVSYFFIFGDKSCSNVN